MEELKPIIARNIARLRQQAGMTQWELAEKLHYSDKAVSKWERGESIPDVGVLKQIADLFRVTVDSLLKADPAPPDAPSADGASLHTRRLVAAITMLGVAALAILMFIILRTWLVPVYMLPAATIVWLVFNTLWFDRRRNRLIISILMWVTLLCVCITFAAFGISQWETLLLGVPGQIIIWLCFQFSGRKESA